MPLLPGAPAEPKAAPEDAKAPAPAAPVEKKTDAAPVPEAKTEEAPTAPAATPEVPAAAERQHVFDNPRNVRRVIWALVAVCAVSFVLDFFVHRHVDHPWEALFGFYAFYGFGACVALVLLAKEMRKLVMRGEDYYDD